MGHLLLREEIAELTGKQTPSAQCRALSAMNIPYLIRPNGTPAVARAAADQALGVQSANKDDYDVFVDVDAI